MWFHNCVSLKIRFAAPLLALMLAQGCAVQMGRDKPEERLSPELQTQLQGKYEQALGAIRQGHLEQARLLLEEVIRLQPGLATPYVNLGIIAERQGARDEAKNWYEKALEVDPSQPEALNQLGVLYREEGQFDKALACYQRALSANSELPQVHYNLAILYDLYLGDYGRAITHYERYQALSADQNEKVAQWLMDLKRRVQ